MSTSDHDPSDPPRSDVSRLLDKAADGNVSAVDQLLPLVYDQLRAVAQQRMAGERVGHTLQATAPVHEAFLRLVGPREIPWQSQAHFYAAAAESMRRILVDHARSRKREIRGGKQQRVALNVLDLAQTENPEEFWRSTKLFIASSNKSLRQPKWFASGSLPA